MLVRRDRADLLVRGQQNLVELRGAGFASIPAEMTPTWPRAVLDIGWIVLVGGGIAVAVLWLIWMFTPIASLYYPEPTIAIEPEVASAGDNVTVTGSNFVSHETVVLCAISVSGPGKPGLNSATVQDITTVTADGGGSFKATVTLPEDGIIGAQALTSHHFVVSKANSETVNNVLGGPPGCKV